MVDYLLLTGYIEQALQLSKHTPNGGYKGIGFIMSASYYPWEENIDNRMKSTKILR